MNLHITLAELKRSSPGNSEERLLYIKRWYSTIPLQPTVNRALASIGPWAIGG